MVYNVSMNYKGYRIDIIQDDDYGLFSYIIFDPAGNTVDADFGYKNFVVTQCEARDFVDRLIERTQ